MLGGPRPIERATSVSIFHLSLWERHPVAQDIPAGCPVLPVGDLVALAGSDGGAGGTPFLSLSLFLSVFLHLL